MGASCEDQRKAVAICLQRSPCVLIERNKPSDCLGKKELYDELPELCKAQFKTFMDCKSGIFDGRKRFRGNGTLSTGKYDATYVKLSTGDYDAQEEMKKLQGLNSNAK